MHIYMFIYVCVSMHIYGLTLTLTSSMVAAGAAANTTERNSRVSRVKVPISRGYHTRIGSFCGRSSVHMPKR